MESISNISFIIPVETARSRRTALLKELYVLYISQPEINQRENRKRYRFWMHQNHPEACKRLGFSQERYDQYKSQFKKAKLPKEEKFVSYIKEDRFWYFFSHIPTDDLSYLISRARDAQHRNLCVGKVIMGSIKYEK